MNGWIRERMFKCARCRECPTECPITKANPTRKISRFSWKFRLSSGNRLAVPIFLTSRRTNGRDALVQRMRLPGHTEEHRIIVREKCSLFVYKFYIIKASESLILPAILYEKYGDGKNQELIRHKKVGFIKFIRIFENAERLFQNLSEGNFFLGKLFWHAIFSMGRLREFERVEESVSWSQPNQCNTV